MKIALIQLDVIWEAIDANLAKAAELIQEAAGKGADVAVFPEMFNTGFTMNLKAIGDSETGKTHSTLSSLSAENRINIIAGYSVLDTDRKKGRNLAAVYDRDGKRSALYSKMYPFPLTGEDEYYRAGDAPVVFSVDNVSSSVFICYDLRFPEAMRVVAKEVFIIFFLANWPASRSEHWEALLKARAIENQCFIAGVNRVGTDGNGITYDGGSHVFGPGGETICKGSSREEIVICGILPENARKVRTELPFLKDIKSN